MSIINSDRHHPLLFSFTNGIDTDSRLVDEEVKVQKAWAKGLNGINILTNQELLTADTLLSDFQAKAKKGDVDWKVEDEDIHMTIEKFITTYSQDLGYKIHSGRSRNDLIATTLRLYFSKRMKELKEQNLTLIKALNKKSEVYQDVLIPALTHNQSGLPMSFKHLLQAHGAAAERDVKRINESIESCMDYLPMGAAACTGTHLGIDLEQMSQDLGFHKPLKNSYDAVRDRDFILQCLNTLAIASVHITQMMNEIIFFSATAVGIITLPANLSTGSSIMPNKRNPDIPELIRAKMSRVQTSSQEAMSIARSITPSYCSDLHEIKRSSFASFDEWEKSIEILIPFIEGIEVDKSKSHQLLMYGHILATDIANDQEGINEKDFRRAYNGVKKQIKNADEQKIQVHQLPEHKSRYSFKESIRKRNNSGGTGSYV